MKAKQSIKLEEHFRRATKEKEKEQNLHREKIVESDDPEVRKAVAERIKSLASISTLLS